MPTGRSTPTCVEEEAGGLQENSYQETLPGGYEPAATTKNEVLECVERGSERSTLAHGKKDRAGDLQENFYQEILSGKNRVPNIQTEVQGVIAPREPTTDDELTIDKTHNENASEVDEELRIVNVYTVTCIHSRARARPHTSPYAHTEAPTFFSIFSLHLFHPREHNPGTRVRND